MTVSAPGTAGVPSPASGSAHGDSTPRDSTPARRTPPRSSPRSARPRSASPLPSSPLRFAIIGQGALAEEMLRLISENDASSAELCFVGHVTRDPGSLEGMLPLVDAVVEVAGVGAVGEYGPGVVAAGRDLVVASIGAFADPELLPRLRAAGPGRVHLTNGAIGGLDLLRAAGRTGGLGEVRVQSRKLPSSLLQPWMTPAQQARLGELTEPEQVFSGGAEEAIELFPASLNVAVAVQLAVGAELPLVVELVADPAATLTEHEISASGPAGEYRFSIKNEPLAARPASSGLTARALVADLLWLAERR